MSLKPLGVFLLAFCSATAIADTVEFKSGARLTGTVVKIAGGVITFNSDDVGEVQIKEEKIASLVTEKANTIQYNDKTTEDGVIAMKDGKYTVALWNFGAKNSTVANLNAQGCNVISMPASSTAEEILAWANVSCGDTSNDEPWRNERGDVSISARQINAIIKDDGLDVLCENVERFLQKHYKDKVVFGGTENLINVTGEGIGCVKGETEHFSARLNCFMEVVAPDLPYCDKPSFSSRMALLDTAISDKERAGWLRRILNNFGGKKK
jgi:hypothetical protein